MYLSGTESQITDDGVRYLVRAIQRFHYATKQDVNPLVAGLHNAYSYALMNALLELTGNGKIKELTGVDPEELKQEILHLRDKHEGVMIALLRKMQEKGLSFEELLKKI